MAAMMRGAGLGGREMPAMNSSMYASSTTPISALAQGIGIGSQGFGAASPLQQMLMQQDLRNLDNSMQSDEMLRQRGAFVETISKANQQAQEQKIMAASTGRRLVKVVIADTDESVPLTSCLLYNGSEMLTDLSDQELFFEIDIRTILAKHNEQRVTFPKKDVKDRTEMLAPARVRDLKMTVVTIATF